MLDSGAEIRQQRSHGQAMASFAARDGRMRLVDLAQRGSAKAMLPRVLGDAPELVFLNTSGGLTSGDRLDFAATVSCGALSATTQTAERAYAAPHGPAQVSVRLEAGPGARLAWLPQETILFESSDLQRETTITLHGDAVCLMLETLVLGRVAMGERPEQARLTDRRLVTRDGVPVWAETLRLTPEALARETPAMLGQARAFAVMALIAPGAEDALGLARSALGVAGVAGAATALPGRCLIRLSAADGWPLRQQISRLTRALGYGPLPRVWQWTGESP